LQPRIATEEGLTVKAIKIRNKNDEQKKDPDKKAEKTEEKVQIEGKMQNVCEP